MIEYSKNYRKTRGRSSNCYRDEPGNPLSSNPEYFKYKTSITGNTYGVGADGPGYDANKADKNETEVAIPPEHLSNFWRAFKIPLINCEVKLILTWSKNCGLANMAAANNPLTGLEFEITDTKLYVPVVTLSKENDRKLLEQLKSGFERTIKWNKYRSQMTVQPQNNNLNYVTDSTFTKVNRLYYLFKEMLQKITQQKIIETLFHTAMYQTLK